MAERIKEVKLSQKTYAGSALLRSHKTHNEQFNTRSRSIDPRPNANFRPNDYLKTARAAHHSGIGSS